MPSFVKKPPLPVLVLGAVIAVLALLHLLSRVAERSARIVGTENAAETGIALEAVSYAALPGWSRDELGEAIPVFLRSCVKIWRAGPTSLMNSQENPALLSGLSTVSGEVSDWLGPCAIAQKRFEGSGRIPQEDARGFFESFFRPFRVTHPQAKQNGDIEMVERGLVTGYFEPVYDASTVPTTRFTVPVLPRPSDLIAVDLGQFDASLKGTSLRGRLEGRNLIPYDDHQAIIEQGVDEKPLAWMDPDDLLFLQIQGSGKLRIDGQLLRLGYDGKNGHPYTAIGKALIARDEIAREDMSMQAIRKWLKSASPRDAAELRYTNRSYVFFRLLENLAVPALGPVGAQGVQLTARRSLAVDRRFYAMGMPVFVALTSALEGESEKFRHLLITQDTGGAIKGAVRGDIFTGSGDAAAREAGPLKARGTFYILLPKALAMRVAEQSGGAHP